MAFLSTVSSLRIVGAIRCTRLLNESSSILRKLRYADGSEYRISWTSPWYAPYWRLLANHSLCHVFLFRPLSFGLFFSHMIDVNKNKLVSIISSSESLEAMFVCRTLRPRRAWESRVSDARHKRRCDIALRWTSYVAPKRAKGTQKRKTAVFHLKSQFAWRKSATKFLCVKTISDKVVRRSLAYLSVQ